MIGDVTPYVIVNCLLRDLNENLQDQGLKRTVKGEYNPDQFDPMVWRLEHKEDCSTL